MSTQNNAEKTGYATIPRLGANQAIELLYATIDQYTQLMLGDISVEERKRCERQIELTNRSLLQAFDATLQSKM